MAAADHLLRSSDASQFLPVPTGNCSQKLMLPRLQGKWNGNVSKLFPSVEVVGRGINRSTVKDDLTMFQGADFQLSLIDFSLYFKPEPETL